MPFRFGARSREHEPAWSRYLQGNVRYYFDDSLHFLRETGDTQLPKGSRD